MDEVTFKVEMDGYGGFVIRKPDGKLLQAYYAAGIGIGGMAPAGFDDMGKAIERATKLAQTEARYFAEKGVVVFKATAQTRCVCGVARGAT